MAETQTWILFPKDANKEIAQSIQIKVGKKLEKLNAVVYEAKEIPLLVSSAYDCYPNATVRAYHIFN